MTEQVLELIGNLIIGGTLLTLFNYVIAAVKDNDTWSTQQVLRAGKENYRIVQHNGTKDFAVQCKEPITHSFAWWNNKIDFRETVDKKDFKYETKAEAKKYVDWSVKYYTNEIADAVAGFKVVK